MEAQSHRRRWMVVGIVVVVVAAGGVVSNALTQDATPSGRPTPVASPSTTGAPARPAAKAQRTLLLQVRDDDRRIIYSGLFATSSGTLDGARLQLPSDLLVPVPAWTTLRFTGDAADTLQSQHAIEQLLGVDIDISLVLDRLALSGFYDATLEPAMAARAKASTDIDTWVNLALATFPARPEDAGQLLLSLGHMARSSSSNADLVDLLLALRKDVRADRLAPVSLPVQPVRAGAAISVLRTATDATVKAHFPRTLLTPGQASTPRVLLVPAGASASQLAQATDALLDAGMTVIPGAVVAPVEATRITSVPDSLTSSKIGARAARALGFLAEEVRAMAGTPVDVRVVLGPDYVPL